MLVIDFWYENSYPIILIEKDLASEEYDLELFVDNIIENIYATISYEAPLLNINQICNADFKLSNQYWHLETPISKEFTFALVTAENWNLEHGQTAYLLQANTIKRNMELVYKDPVVGEFLPVVANSNYQLGGSFACHRCDAIFKLEFYNAQYQVIQTNIFEIASEKTGGKYLEDYHTIAEQVCAPKQAFFSKITILKLPTNKRSKESNSLLFFTKLFFAETPKYSNKIIAWKSFVTDIDTWKRLRANNFSECIRLKFQLPKFVYDGEEHLIKFQNHKTGTSLFKFTELQHQEIIENYKLAVKINATELINELQQQLNYILESRFELVIDGFSETQNFHGWLSDKIYPKQVVTLELLDNGIKISTTNNQNIHKNYGRGGFGFNLPVDILDARVHKFSIYIKEYHAIFEIGNFITPVLEKSPALDYVTNPLWDTLALTVTQKIIKQLPKTYVLDKKVSKLLLELSSISLDNLNAQYALRCQLGQIFLNHNQFESALEQFTLAAKINVISPDAFIKSIQILITLGKEQAAKDLVDEALNLFATEAQLLILADKLAANKRIKQSKIIAFYLPQFHPIPENDKWWGQGFTEWHNVGAAKPLFTGHNQPRIPGALGYYDLRLAEAANAQFELARQYGINGFCYYYYWFHGKRILEKPLQDLVDGKTDPFPFCICWANEDWTRSWDGNSGEILLAQEHTPESDFKFIQDLAPLLKHPDYIRVEGKPVVLIYRVEKLATPVETIAAWRVWCLETGIGELHLCAVQAFGFDDPTPFGLDAAVEFPPHTAHEKYPDLGYRTPATNIQDLTPEFTGEILSYSAVAKAAMQRPRENYTLHRGCFLAWDNTARRQQHASIFHGFNTTTYQNWLTDIVVKNVNEQATGLTFINAWNEWAEGTTLEPDQVYGHELLEKTARVQELTPFLAQKTYWKHGQALIYLQHIATSEHIILVGHDANFNGAQINLLNMARSLRRDLHMQVVIVLINGGELLADYEKIGATLVVGTEDNWETKLLNFLSVYTNIGFSKAICNTVVTGKIAKLLVTKDYQVISLVHELPALISAYGLEAECWQLSNHAHNIVFASKWVAQQFCERYWPSAEKVVITPQGVVENPYHSQQQLRNIIREELNLASTTLIVIGCGYADTRKGIDLFIRMAGEVSQTVQDQTVAFIWVGELEHNLAPYLLADIERLGLQENFHITGKTNNPARYFIAGDVFALTSREDPFPSVVMEAFDAEMPVVAFAGGGGYVDIVNATTGALVPYLDVSAMTMEISRLLNDEQQRITIGKNNHVLCRQKFTYPPYLRKLLALLNAVPAEQVEQGLLQHQSWNFQTKPPTISVIVPNYNYGRYLELRLLTILSQTLKPTEIIILDDASTDYSLDLIQKIAATTEIPIHIHTNTINTGNPFVQWEAGIALASSELIWIAEADDYCEPILLETLATQFLDPEVNLAWTDSIMVDDNGNGEGFEYKKYYAEHYGEFWQQDFKIAGNELIDKCLLVANVVPNASAVLFRRTAVTEDLNLIKQYKFSGDWWFWISMAQTGKVFYSAQALNYHRRHNCSVMGEVLEDSQKFLTESMDFFQRIIMHKAECLTNTVKLQIVARIAGMYNLFPELVNAYPQIQQHPEFKLQYQEIITALQLTQAVAEIHTKTSATLLISAEVLADPNTALLIAHYQRKHELQIIFYAEAEDEYLKNYIDVTDNIKIIAPELDISAVSIDFKPVVISFGLAAHYLVNELVNKQTTVWTIIAGIEFDSLLGKLPAAPITVLALTEAIQQCQQVYYISEQLPVVCSRLATASLQAVDKLTLKSAIKITSTDTIYCLGVVNNATTAQWHTIATILHQLELEQDYKLILRLLIWGDVDEILLAELSTYENIELVTIFVKPEDFSKLAHFGVAFQPTGQKLNYLQLDFQQAQLPAVIFKAEDETHTWSDSISQILSQYAHS